MVVGRIAQKSYKMLHVDDGAAIVQGVFVCVHVFVFVFVPVCVVVLCVLVLFTNPYHVCCYCPRC